MQSIVIMFDKVFFNIESLKLDKQFLSIVFSEYGNYYLLFFDITSNFLEKNIYAILLTRCDDACVTTPYLFYIYNFNFSITRYYFRTKYRYHETPIYYPNILIH